MEEFIENLMKFWKIDKAGRLEYSICKVIESWNMQELFTVSNNTSNKEV